MAIPKEKDIYDSKAVIVWTYIHRNIVIEINYHSHGLYREVYDNDEGVWCYYMTINELMFPTNERWRDFNCIIKNDLIYPAESFERIWFHGGITYCRDFSQWNHRVKREIRCVKIGCDYNHLGDRAIRIESVYDKEKLLSDAKCSIDNFLATYKDCNTELS